MDERRHRPAGQHRDGLGRAHAAQQGAAARAHPGADRGRGGAVAAAEGMGAVSMGRVATELGVSTMSLYRYVAAKDELLALMVDVTLGAAGAEGPGGGLAGRPVPMGVDGARRLPAEPLGAAGADQRAAGHPERRRPPR